jgi:hypothetical protein
MVSAHELERDPGPRLGPHLHALPTAEPDPGSGRPARRSPWFLVGLALVSLALILAWSSGGALRLVGTVVAGGLAAGLVADSAFVLLD